MASSDRGREGVKNPENFAYVLNGSPLVPNRSPKEVQNQTSFGLLFDIGIEKVNNEVEFASN